MSECPLCGKRLVDDSDIVGFSHFIDDPKHRLWRYSDSTMHRSCFTVWRDRDEFVELHNRFFRTFPHADGRCRQLAASGEYFLLDPITGETEPWE